MKNEEKNLTAGGLVLAWSMQKGFFDVIRSDITFDTVAVHVYQLIRW